MSPVSDDDIAARAGTQVGAVGGLLGGGLSCGLLSAGSVWTIPVAVVSAVVIGFVGRALGRKAGPSLERGTSPYVLGVEIAFVAAAALGCVLGLLAVVTEGASIERALVVLGITVAYTVIFGSIPAIALGLVFGALVNAARRRS